MNCLNCGIELTEREENMEEGQTCTPCVDNELDNCIHEEFDAAMEDPSEREMFFNEDEQSNIYSGVRFNELSSGELEVMDRNDEFAGTIGKNEDVWEFMPEPDYNSINARMMLSIAIKLQEYNHN